MPWFKVDDGFGTSEPVMRVKRRYRASVIGLWTLSGTWCAKELTDGRVPFHMLDELACTKAQAGLLVECGLWANHPEGFVFIGWDKYQPTRAKVEAERKKEAERKANYRMSRGDTGGTPAGLPKGHQVESGHPDPTRPDPTRPLKEEASLLPADGKKKPEIRLPNDWVPTAAHYERSKANGLDIAKQVESFKLHADTHDRHAANWNAAFTTWLSKAKPNTKGGGSDWALRQ